MGATVAGGAITRRGLYFFRRVFLVSRAGADFRDLPAGLQEGGGVLRNGLAGAFCRRGLLGL